MRLKDRINLYHLLITLIVIIHQMIMLKRLPIKDIKTKKAIRRKFLFSQYYCYSEILEFIVLTVSFTSEEPTDFYTAFLYYIFKVSNFVMKMHIYEEHFPKELIIQILKYLYEIYATPELKNYLIWRKFKTIGSSAANHRLNLLRTTLDTIKKVIFVIDIDLTIREFIINGKLSSSFLVLDALIKYIIKKENLTFKIISFLIWLMDFISSIMILKWHFKDFNM